MATGRGWHGGRLVAAAGGILVLCGTVAGCGSSAQEQDPGFFLVVQLPADLEAATVDQVHVQIDAPWSEWSPRGPSDDQTLWEPGEGPEQHQLVLAGDLLRERALVVAPGVEELDLSLASPEEEGTLAVRASAYWRDTQGEAQLIAYGAAAVTFPFAGEFPHHVVSLGCDRAWRETCLTGCAPAVVPCSPAGECLGATESCVSGCCLPQE